MELLPETVIAMASRFSGFTREGPTGGRVDLSGGCEAPVMRTIKGRPLIREGRSRSWKRGEPVPQWIDAELRCRNCAWCLRQRANLWRFRTQVEIAAARRTWFATLTCNPEQVFKADLKAAQRTDTFSQVEEDRFANRCVILGRELTLFYKRLRDVENLRLRHITVAEAHKSGVPHWHALIHEVGDEPILHRHLVPHWRIGFAKFKLVDGSPRSAGYVTKYLNKDARARVRASIRYGKHALECIANSVHC